MKTCPIDRKVTKAGRLARLGILVPFGELCCSVSYLLRHLGCHARAPLDDLLFCEGGGSGLSSHQGFDSGFLSATKLRLVRFFGSPLLILLPPFLHSSLLRPILTHVPLGRLLALPQYQSCQKIKLYSKALLKFIIREDLE